MKRFTTFWVGAALLMAGVAHAQRFVTVANSIGVLTNANMANIHTNYFVPELGTGTGGFFTFDRNSVAAPDGFGVYAPASGTGRIIRTPVDLAGRLTLSNNVAIRWENSGGTLENVITLNASDDLAFTPSGGLATVVGDFDASGGFRVAGTAPGGAYLRGDGTRGTFTQIDNAELWPARFPTVIVAEGDSLTYHSTGFSWAWWLTNSFGFTNILGTYTNAAVSGSRLDQLTNRYSASIINNKPGAGTNGLLLVWIGANGMVPAGVWEAADFNNTISNYWAGAKTNGFKVCAVTITPSTTFYWDNDYRETRRHLINNFIRTSEIPDYVVDADAMFPNCFDTAVFYDGIHLSTNASYRLAQEANRVLRHAKRVPPTIEVARANGTNFWWRSSVTGAELMMLNGLGQHRWGTPFASQKGLLDVNGNIAIGNGFKIMDSTFTSGSILQFGSDMTLGANGQIHFNVGAVVPAWNFNTNEIWARSGPFILQVTNSIGQRLEGLRIQEISGDVRVLTRVEDDVFGATYVAFDNDLTHSANRYHLFPIGDVGIRGAPLSSLHVMGSFGTSLGAGGSATLGATNGTYLLNVNANTVTLPTVLTTYGRIYTVKLVAPATSGTIATTAGQLIDGAATYSLTASNNTVTVQSDANTWRVISTDETPSSVSAAPFIMQANSAGFSTERALAGTVNQVILTDGGANSTMTLSLPQSIATTSGVTFGNVTDSALTSGQVPFASTGGLLANSSMFVLGAGVAAQWTGGAGISVFEAVPTINVYDVGGYAAAAQEAVRILKSSTFGGIGTDSVGAGTMRPMRIGSDIGASYAMEFATDNVSRFNRGVRVPRRATAIAATLDATDYYLACTAGGFTVALPDASTVGSGFIYVVKDAAGGAGAANITLDPTGGDTIDGAATFVINVNFRAVQLISDGNSNYEIVSVSP